VWVVFYSKLITALGLRNSLQNIDRCIPQTTHYITQRADLLEWIHHYGTRAAVIQVSLCNIYTPHLPYLYTQVTTESFLALEEEGFLSIMFFPAVHLKDEKIRVLVLTKKV
jgi:hypothetical protein